jgi:hypothetical protein
MDGIDDFSNDDVWSPSLREELFSDYSLGSLWESDARHHVEDLPLQRPSLPSAHPPSQPTLIQQQQQRLHNTDISNPPIFHFQGSAPLERKHSHLDLPNFPLATNPTGGPSNSSGRPPFPASTQIPPRIPTPLPPSRVITPPRLASPPRFDNFSFSSESPNFDSERSDTPWPESEQGDFNGYVDLTQDSSPPTMPPGRRTQTPTHHPIPHRKFVIRQSSLHEHLSDGSSNPAKRRKTGTNVSQSSQRSHKIEEVDLRDVDDDRGLSKVLEQQRMATVKAQQEQANKPIKLSTLQCIICMENMKDLTATHCGKPWSTLHIRQNCQLTQVLSRPSFLSQLPHGSAHSGRKSRIRSGQRHF